MREVQPAGGDTAEASTFPAWRSAFVGREQALVAIERASRMSGAVVTLVGAPGIGKTRLACEHAMRQADARTFLDLADARTDKDLRTIAAAALGAPTIDRDALGQIFSASGAATYVVDNFEQLPTEAAQTLAAWARTAKNARFIATSRTRLKVDGERVVRVEPLGLATTSGGFATSEAGALLLDAVRTSARSYRPSTRELDALAEVVVRLDGIPLAIELAAPRIALLGARTVRDMLRTGKDTSTSRARGAVERQRTMRHAVEWSVRLLDPSELAAVAQCTVFRGGFTRDAVESVVRVPDEDRTSLDAIESLYEKSLLGVAGGSDDERRFELYLSVREVASRRLSVPETELAEERHAHFFVALAERLSNELSSPRAREALHRALSDWSNFLAAAERSVLRAPDRALGLLAALEPIAMSQGALGELEPLIERALSEHHADETPNVARALYTRAAIRRLRGDLAGARADLERALGISRRHEQPLAQGRILRRIAVLELSLGRADRAREVAMQALDVIRPRGDLVLESQTLHVLGSTFTEHGERASAIGCYEEALRVARVAGDPRGEALATFALGSALAEERRLREARTLVERSVALCEELGERVWTGSALRTLAIIAHVERELERAQRLYAAAIAADSLSANRRSSAYTLVYSGWLALERVELDAAATRLEEAKAILTTFGEQRMLAFTEILLAAIDARAGRRDEALACLERAERLAQASGTDAIVAPLLYEARWCIERVLNAPPTTKDAAPPGSTGAAAPEIELWRAARAALFEPRHATVLAQSVTVDARGRWFQLEAGERVSCAAKATLARILVKLARRRVRKPGEPVPFDVLVRAGWPGERIGEAAAKNRLKVAITTLRALGLRDLITHRDGGYLFAPEVPLRFSTG